MTHYQHSMLWTRRLKVSIIGLLWHSSFNIVSSRLTGENQASENQSQVMQVPIEMQEGGAEAPVAGRCQVQAHVTDDREHVSSKILDRGTGKICAPSVRMFEVFRKRLLNLRLADITLKLLSYYRTVVRSATVSMCWLL